VTEPATTAGRRLLEALRLLYVPEPTTTMVRAIESEAREATIAELAWSGPLVMSGEQAQAAHRHLDRLVAESRQQERERLRDEFHAYWEWLVTQPVYGNGGGWGEAAMMKVSSLLAPHHPIDRDGTGPHHRLCHRRRPR
jgi:hypothetical protein